MNQLNLYRVIYMLPTNMEDKNIEEFIKKLEEEIVKVGGEIKFTERNKNYMVKTSQNKGARGNYTVETICEIPPAQMPQIAEFIKLAREIVVNSMILKLDDETFAQISGKQKSKAN